jgi:hypothetical protein
MHGAIPAEAMMVSYPSSIAACACVPALSGDSVAIAFTSTPAPRSTAATSAIAAARRSGRCPDAGL